MKEFIIEKKDSGQRVDKFLIRILPNATKSFLYKMIRKKNIVVNDKKIEGNEILKEKDSVKIWFSDDTFNKFSNKGIVGVEYSEYNEAYRKLQNIKVLYEDEHFLVIYKPAGILSQKANKDDLSLNEWIVGYCLNNKSVSIENLSMCKPSIANRLDRNTSGIVLGGKTVYGLNIFTECIRNRNLKKYYLTYVLGELKGSKLLTGYHKKDDKNNIVNIISQDEYLMLSENEKCDYSVVSTLYNAIDSFVIDIDGRDIIMTKVEIDLITGKSHQIRAHMAHIGHPLLGDDKYGNKKINKILNLKYQLLHAYKVVFDEDFRLNELSGKEIICQPSNLEDFEDRFLKK